MTWEWRLSAFHTAAENQTCCSEPTALVSVAPRVRHTNVFRKRRWRLHDLAVWLTDGPLNRSCLRLIWLVSQILAPAPYTDDQISSLICQIIIDMSNHLSHRLLSNTYQIYSDFYNFDKNEPPGMVPLRLLLGKRVVMMIASFACVTVLLHGTAFIQFHEKRSRRKC